jgi:hypothetical protein
LLKRRARTCPAHLPSMPSLLRVGNADLLRKFVRLIDQYNKVIPDIIHVLEYALKDFKFASGDAGGPCSAIAALSVLILLPHLTRLTFPVIHLLLPQLLHNQTGSDRRAQKLLEHLDCLLPVVPGPRRHSSAHRAALVWVTHIRRRTISRRVRTHQEPMGHLKLESTDRGAGGR